MAQDLPDAEFVGIDFSARHDGWVASIVVMAIGEFFSDFGANARSRKYYQTDQRWWKKKLPTKTGSECRRGSR